MRRLHIVYLLVTRKSVTKCITYIRYGYAVARLEILKFGKITTVRNSRIALELERSAICWFRDN